MNSKHIFMLLLATASILSLEAATIANFDDGSGTSSYDQFTGTAGGGWAAGWITDEGGSSNVNAAVTGAISSSSPLNGGGNYLTITDDDTSTNFSVYQRELDTTTSPGVDLSGTYNVSFDVRYDGNMDSSSTMVIYNSSNSAGLGTPNGFELRAYNFTGSGTVEWTFRDNNVVGTQRVAAGMNLVQGDVYSFDLTLYTATNLYDITLTNVTDPATVSMTGLLMRNPGDLTTELLDVFAAGVRGTNATNTASMSIDNISYTIPEPGSLALVLSASIATFMIGRRRR